MNLVGNALKFRDPGRPPVVHVGVRAQERAWEFTVADNGIGIDAQYAERVFVIFQRLHPKDVYEGRASGSRCARGSSSTTAGRSGSSRARGRYDGPLHDRPCVPPGRGHPTTHGAS
ncbi:ATP-binding protein [Oerskovia sp. M15]